MSAGFFLSGLGQGIGEGMESARKRKMEADRLKLQEDIAKLQGKQIEAQLKLQARKEEAMTQIQSLTAPPTAASIAGQGPTLPGAQTGLGAAERVGQPPMNILDMLTNAETSAKIAPLLMQAGMMNIGDLAKIQTMQQQKQWSDPAFLQKLRSEGGMEVSGVNVSPQGSQLQMRQPQVELIEVQQPGGGTMRVPVNKRTGQPLGGGGMQTGLPLTSQPITPTNLNAWRNANNEIPAVGLSPEEAAAQGFTQLPKEDLKAVTSADAGKVAMLSQAQGMVGQAMDVIMPGGQLNPNILLQMSAPKGGVGEGRKAWRLVREGLNAKLRIETGATANDKELDEMMLRFMPGIMDLTSPGIVQSKLSQLQEYMQSAIDLTTLPPSLRKRVESSKTNAQPTTAQPARRIKFQPGGTVGG